MPNDSAEPRRGFLGRMAGGVAALLAGSAVRVQAEPAPVADEKWLAALHGDYRQYFDAVDIAEGFPLLYAYTWSNTMKDTYKLTPAQVCPVLGFRHMSIGTVFNDAIWTKYKLGEFFKQNDPKTGKPSTRNFYNSTAAGDVRQPGSDLGSLMKNGAVVVACNVATTIISGLAAKAAGLTVKPEDAYKEWAAGLVPGVMLVPSGVLAVHRAQTVGKCTYCSAMV